MRLDASVSSLGAALCILSRISSQVVENLTDIYCGEKTGVNWLVRVCLIPLGV